MQDLNFPAMERARKAKGVSLEQISALTKISVRWLQAIESSEFKKLPGGIYDMSYIRQYADAIGWDAAELLADYRAKTEILPAAPIAKTPGSSFLGSLRAAFA